MWGRPKGYSRSWCAQKQCLRQPIHFTVKPGYLQVLNASRVQWCLGKTNFIICPYAEYGHGRPAHVYDVLFQICICFQFWWTSDFTIGNANCMKITWHHSERPCPFDYLSEILQVCVQLLRGAILSVFKRPWNKVTLRKVVEAKVSLLHSSMAACTLCVLLPTLLATCSEKKYIWPK